MKKNSNKPAFVIKNAGTKKSIHFDDLLNPDLEIEITDLNF